MNKGILASGDLLRVAGTMAICVGVAWACQVLGFGSEGTAFTRMLWELGAAAIAGAGVGAVYAASMLDEQGSVPARA